MVKILCILIELLERKRALQFLDKIIQKLPQWAAIWRVTKKVQRTAARHCRVFCAAPRAHGAMAHQPTY